MSKSFFFLNKKFIFRRKNSHYGGVSTGSSESSSGMGWIPPVVAVERAST
jgi:hypothetical protein